MQAKDKGTALFTMSNIVFPMPTAKETDYKGALGIGHEGNVIYLV